MNNEREDWERTEKEEENADSIADAALMSPDMKMSVQEDSNFVDGSFDDHEMVVRERNSV